MSDDIKFVFDENTQTWKPYEPYASIDIETEEDFNRLQEMLAFAEKRMKQNATTWIAVRIEPDNYPSSAPMNDACEHLAMSGCTYNTDCDDTVFIVSEELDHLTTYLQDNNISYEIL